MKSTMQKRGVASQRNRYNSGFSKGPGYANTKRSSRQQREWNWNIPSLQQQNDESFQRRRSRDRFNEYASGRNQATPHQMRYENNDEYFYEYMQPDINQDYYFDDNDYRWDDQRRDHYERRQPRENQYSQEHVNLQNQQSRKGSRPRFMNNYGNRYGEHPASMGRAEYFGSNKRRNGLGNYNKNFFYEPYYKGDSYFDEELKKKKITK